MGANNATDEHTRFFNAVADLVRNDCALSAVVSINRIDGEFDVYASIHDEISDDCVVISTVEQVGRVEFADRRDTVRQRKIDELKRELERLEDVE